MTASAGAGSEASVGAGGAAAACFVTRTLADGTMAMCSSSHTGQRTISMAA